MNSRQSSRGRYKEREDKVLLELLDGRPENTKGRLEKEIRVYDFLDHLGIEYKRVDHVVDAHLSESGK